MAQDILRINMLGTFSLSYGDKRINCVSNRSKLIWNILAYLICHRGEMIHTEELISAVWDSPKNVNPAGAMRTAIFRARQMLNELTGESDCRFLISHSGGYVWNTDVPAIIDIEEFEKLSTDIANNPDNVSLYLSALNLYDGKFLSMQSSELWVLPVQAYYQNMYQNIIDKAVPLLEKSKNYNDGITIFRKALSIEPFLEVNYQYLMRFLLMSDDRQEVIKVYEDMSKLLLSTLDVMPDQESRALYREALFSVNNTHIVAPEIAFEQLREKDDIKGALICDYDFFKVIYQAHARSMMRSGIAIHSVMLTLKNRKDVTASKSSLTTAMDNLEKHLSRSLRKGDIITRCSSSQFLIMLLSANFESSVKVCQRFISSFEKKYPRSPFFIDYFVQVLNPSTES